jgi:nucleosome-remodeling factor subunit BPTF
MAIFTTVRTSSLTSFFLCLFFAISCSESEDGDVWYYSTPVQLEELLQTFDRENMEVALSREISDFKEEIIRQMEITEKLTNLNKGNKKSYLDVENSEFI